jgi:hypothetical protein
MTKLGQAKIESREILSVLYIKPWQIHKKTGMSVVYRWVHLIEEPIISDSEGSK